MHGEELIYALKERLSEINKDTNFYEYICILVELKEQIKIHEEYLKENENITNADISYTSNLVTSTKKDSFWSRFISFLKNLFKKKNTKNITTKHADDTATNIEKKQEIPLTESKKIEIEKDDDLPNVDIEVPTLKEDNVEIELTDYIEDKIIATYNQIKEEENKTIELHKDAVQAEIENEEKIINLHKEIINEEVNKQ